MMHLKYSVLVFKWIIYITYVLLLGYVVFIGGNDYRHIDLFAFSKTINLIPVKTKIDFFYSEGPLYPKDYFYFILQMVGNVLLLFPIPLLLMLGEGKRNTKKILLLTVAISIAIECAQMLLDLGEFDIDDVILNTLGAALGIKVATWIKRKIFRYRPQSVIV